MPEGHSDHMISMPSKKVECLKLLLIMSRFRVFSVTMMIPKIILTLLSTRGFRRWRQDSILYIKYRTGLEKVCEWWLIFWQTTFGSPSSINLLARPCFQLDLILIAHYMAIYFNLVEIGVIACTRFLEKLDFSEFLDAMRACCRQD